MKEKLMEKGPTTLRTLAALLTLIGPLIPDPSGSIQWVLNIFIPTCRIAAKCLEVNQWRLNNKSLVFIYIGKACETVSVCLDKIQGASSVGVEGTCGRGGGMTLYIQPGECAAVHGKRIGIRGRGGSTVNAEGRFELIK